MDPVTASLRNSENIILASHINPDGDAIGSLLALGLAMDSYPKNVTLCNVSSIPTVYRFLPGVDRIVQTMDDPERYDLAVVLDCGELDRLGAIALPFSRIPLMINIDHHQTNTRFGHYQIIDTNACATAEIIYHLLNKMEIRITGDIATSIYTGILTDTGSFRFSNTNKAAFAICDEMVAKGVDPYKVAKHVYGTYSLGRLKLLNLALESIEISYNGKLSMMTITHDMFMETGTQPEDVDGMITYAKRIEDVKVAVLIQEQINGSRRTNAPHYHVSLRSDGSIDVARIAKSFGGGGHINAAGFNIRSTISDLKSGILDLAKDF